MEFLLKKNIVLMVISLLSIGLTSTAFTEVLGDNYTSLVCPTSLGIPERPYVDANLAEDDTHMTADEAEIIENGISTLVGNAEITRNAQQVTAGTIKYNQPKDTSELSDNVNYWDTELFLRSDDAFLQHDNGTGEFSYSDFILKDSRGRGTAEKLVLDIGTRTDMEQLYFSTCDPEDRFWSFTASSLSLDHENNNGKARNVILKIKDVPVFYTPYMSFPLSKERKTGFLTPSYGSTNKNGFEALTPYYWNIKPNMDATITPRLLTNNGIMAMGEFRYLNSSGSGTINAEYLPSDNRRGDNHRNFIDLELNQKFANTGDLFATYSRVSDKFYHEDFGSQLSATSTSFLEQRADVAYSGNNWNVFARVQNFQTVNRSIPTSSRPYKRLPQIQFNYNAPKENNKLNYGLSSEAVYFDKGDNIVTTNGIESNTNVNGLRLNLDPYISFPMSTVATFLEPKLRLRFTQYALEKNALFDSSPNRILPIFSLNSGIFLERETNLFNTDYIHTFEPRLYYLFVPHDDQTDLPVFDTGQYTISFASLFYEDRFSNADRVGDANQLTLAVTSRLITKYGQEIGDVSLGQTIYFRDRKVTLPGSAARDEATSSFIAAFNTNIIKDMHISGNFQWNPNVSSNTEKMTLQTTYNPGPGKILNLSYRNVRNNEVNIIGTSIEQSDISFHWPFQQNWSFVGRWNHSIREGRSLELFGGIEYESCCWAVKGVARRFLSNVRGEYDTGIFFQMELKGLAGIGKKTADFLRQNIPGYQSVF